MKLLPTLALGLLLCPMAFADKHQPVSGTLQDLRTVGTTTHKQKHQQYDLVIVAGAQEYTCRSKMGRSVKPTEFVVGSPVQFEVNGEKGRVWNQAGKQLDCGIVRVEAISPTR